MVTAPFGAADSPDAYEGGRHRRDTWLKHAKTCENTSEGCQLLYCGKDQSQLKHCIYFIL